MENLIVSLAHEFTRFCLQRDLILIVYNKITNRYSTRENSDTMYLYYSLLFFFFFFLIALQNVDLFNTLFGDSLDQKQFVNH